MLINRRGHVRGRVLWTARAHNWVANFLTQSTLQHVHVVAKPTPSYNGAFTIDHETMTLMIIIIMSSVG